MAFRRQTVLDGLRQECRRQQHALDVVGLIGILEAIADHGRLFQRFLHVETELGDVQEKLQLCLRLRIRAWSTERDPRFAVAQRHRRVDRLPDALSRLERVDILGIQVEVAHAIVHHEPAALHDDAAAEPAQQARRDRHHVVILVDDRKVGGQVENLVRVERAHGSRRRQRRGIRL
jgi:hypothetical protein